MFLTIRKSIWQSISSFARASLLFAAVFSFSGCNSSSNSLASSVSQFLGIQNVISGFDVPSSFLAGGSSVTLNFAITLPSGSQISQIKLQYAADGSTFKDLDLTIVASDTSVKWTVPKAEASGARLKLVVITDSKSQASETSSAFSVDSTPPSAPTMSLTSKNPAYSTSALFTASHCSDTAWIYASESAAALSDSSSSLALSTSETDGWQKCSTAAAAVNFALTSGAGNKTIYFWAKDAAGNISATSSSVNVTLDPSAPTASFSSPAAGTAISALNQAAFAITGSCSVNGGPVSVTLSDGSHSSRSTTSCNTSTTPNWSVNLNASSLSDTSSNGINAAVIHTNLAGVPSSAVTRTFNKNTGAVSVSITSPTTGGYSNNANTASFTVSGSCSVHGQTVSVSASDGSTSIGAIPTCDTSSTPQWSTSLNLTTLGANITFNASHSDGLGSTANATAVSISKDLSNPNNATSPSWVQASPSTSNSVTASWTQSNSGDLASQSLQYYSDGTCTTAFGSPVSAALASTKAFTGTSGTWSYKVISYDAAGNTNTSACSTAMVLKEASLANSTLAVSHSSIVKGQASTITLTIKDPSGVRNTLGGYTVTFSASAGGGVSTGTISATSDHGNGTYSATFTGTAKGTATTISAAIATVGTVTQTQSITVGNSAPVIIPLATSTYPLNQSTPPVIQGNSVTLATATDADSDTITLSCTYQTLGLNAFDPNYAAAGTNCNTLNTITTSGAPATVVTGKLNSTTTGTLSWTPTLTQRGTYQFTVNATDGTNTATAQTVTVTVRAAYTTTNLLSALDALNATNASGLSSSTASAPFTSGATAGSWLNLFSSASNGALTFGTTNPWGGTGQSSTSSVDPYSLTFNNNSSDSLSLGTVLNAATQFSTETWVKPSPLPSASPAPIIIGNGGGTGNGFVLRQSQVTPDRAEFVVGQKYYSYRDLILSDKPVGYWRLGEISGTTAYDLSANGYHGTYSGSGYSLGQPSIISNDSNKSVLFNGANPYINMGNINPIQSASAYSMEAWVYRTGSTLGTVMGKELAYKFQLNYPAAGNVRFVFSTDGVGWTSAVNTSATIAINTWNHIVAVNTGSNQYIYINGVQDSSITSVSLSASNNGNLFDIGAYGSGAQPHQGLIDEAAIYNYALTPTQITEHYQTGLNGNYKPYPGNAILADKPLAYWRLGEKSGTVAYDSSGNGYNGTYASGITLNQSGALSSDSNGSALFDGTTGYIPVTGIDVGNTFTLEAFFKIDSSATALFPTLIATNTAAGNSNGYRFYVDNTQRFILHSANGSTNSVANTAAGTVPLGVWNHAVAWVDRNQGKVKIYLNGVDITSANTARTDFNTANTMNIGRMVSSGNYFFGNLDEVAIYPYLLSQTQITAHYNSGLGAAWWTCQSQTQLSQSNWNLLSTLYNGTTAKLFVNGQEECSVTPGTTYSGAVANTVIGSNPGRTSNFWQGLLSSIKIFGTGNNTATATSTTIKTNFDSEANRYRSTPVENIVTNGLVLHVDAANAKQGLAPYSNGCASTDLTWFNLSNNSENGTLTSFSSCSATLGWNGTGSVESPYALTFNGSTNYVEFPNNSNLAITGSISIEAWVYPTTATGTRGIVGKTNVNIPAPYDWYIYNGVPKFLLGNGSGVNAVDATSSVSTNTWTYLAVTVSGNNITHYKNGVSNGTGTAGVSRVDAGKSLRIGNRDDLASRFLGSMNTVRIYNRTLTAQEIKQNCLAQEGRFTNTPQSICSAP